MIYREEAVGLKSSNYTLKITIYVNMWNLGQFHEKFDILSMTAQSNFESKNPFCTYVACMIVNICRTPQLASS